MRISDLIKLKFFHSAFRIPQFSDRKFLMSAQKLRQIYQCLYTHYGPQDWWPAEGSWEIMVGAILAQNTAWTNVEKALANLQGSGLKGPPALYRMNSGELAARIRPAGYFNQKAKKLKFLATLVVKEFGGKVEPMLSLPAAELREKLLSLWGVGEETADSILLYAAHRPVFVVDAYTGRVFSRHGFMKAGASYKTVQKLFTDNLPRRVKLFNEYHALIVRVGKEYCKKVPQCEECPLKKFL